MFYKSEYFEREIMKISNAQLQDFVRYFFNEVVGNWFWKSGASSSGRYHPAFAQGEGGLVRHTRAVCWVCEELLKMSSYSYMREEFKDYARVACLLHDTCKYGKGNEEDKSCYRNHGKLAADLVQETWVQKYYEDCPELLLMAIYSHMGQWVENKEDKPFTNIDRLVHLSDYIASRSFWDIPQLSLEYADDELRECAEFTNYDFFSENAPF